MRKCKVGKEKRPAYFHGWFQFGRSDDGIDAMAVVEFEDGACDYFSPDAIVFDDKPTAEERGMAALQTTNSSSHEMPSFADVTKDVQFMTVDEGNKAFIVYSNIARHFGH